LHSKTTQALLLPYKALNSKERFLQVRREKSSRGRRSLPNSDRGL